MVHGFYMLRNVKISIYKKAIFRESMFFMKYERYVKVLRKPSKKKKREKKMGYALFTARKLSLTTRLNNCNALLASNSERTNALTTSIFAKQSEADMKKINANIKAYNEYEKAMDAAGDDEKKQNDAQTELTTALNNAEKESTMSNIRIQMLQQQQNVLDQEKNRLETQLKAYQQELESVEKGEEAGIKSATPKFS